MIKANEVRIGNIVQQAFPITGSWAEKQRLTESLFVINRHTFNRTDFEKYFSPIPLTEEWMLKFGARETKDEFYISDIGSEYGARIVFRKWEKLYCLEGCDDGRVGSYFKYVHQLQNLYFALTGTELEIKPIDNNLKPIL